ncbi:MAG: PEP-CTERM sorting domain-containing protein [Gammaproteobacteria bacterium]|nr:PEP-CTERM sorting domain-containing protein [Gammaproteobacteria bacterium]
MMGMKTLMRMIGTLGFALALVSPATAVVMSVTYVGSWDSVSSGNPPGLGGAGVSVGQKYVLRIAWDDISTTTDGVDVLDAFFNPSGNTMRTINLTDTGNSLDIFVPMEGLDAGTPFIYSQDETDHFPAFVPTPTLNFIDGASISLGSNIIGLEFEGDFVTGGNFNVIELFNTAPTGGSINMVSQVLNCGNVDCTSSAPASNDTNGLAIAVDLVVDAGSDLVYSAADLTRTTSSSISQSNDLGAARADSEDFIDAAWSQTGTVAGNDVTVAIENSGLASTVDSAGWTVTMTEQMTLESDSDSLIVSYMNDLPTASATATATAAGTDFTFAFDDMDLLVNAFIGGFEILTVSALVDGLIDGTAFFGGLITTGLQSNTHAMLEGAFGLGLHTVSFLVTDLVGASVTAAAGFEVLETVVVPVPEPDGLALMMLGLFGLVIARRRSPSTDR